MPSGSSAASLTGRDPRHLETESDEDRPDRRRVGKDQEAETWQEADTSLMGAKTGRKLIVSP